MKKLLHPLLSLALVITACGGGGGEETQPVAVDITLQPNQQSVDDSTPAPIDNNPFEPADDQAAAPTPTPEPAPTPAPNTTPTPAPTPDPAPTPSPVSQWGGKTWNCVSNVPEITARWQLQINHNRTFADLSRPIGDPLRIGTWIDRGNAGFTTLWADNRSFQYQSLGGGFIDDGGSRCHEDFFPARPDDANNTPNDDTPPAEETLPVLADGEWESPVFYCKAWSNPSNVWAWAFSPNGHLRDHNRIIAGSYLFQSEGLKMFITNQHGEQTEWSIVDGKSLTISWGGCAHVTGPTLREVDLSANTSDYCLACH